MCIYVYICVYMCIYVYICVYVYMCKKRVVATCAKQARKEGTAAENNNKTRKR